MIVGFWGTVAMLTIAQDVFDPRVGRGGFRTGEALHALTEYGVWALITPAVFLLSRRFPLERPHLLRNVGLHILVAVAVAVLVDLVDHISHNVLVPSAPHRPVSLLFMLQGFHVLAEVLLYFLILAAGFARDYFLRYRERLHESARLQTQLAEARLQALRMQINPHFLFNTLHTISTYLERDPRGVRRMIARLSELLRYTLDKTDVKEIPLSQELEFLEGYLDIQQIRFDTLEVSCNIEPEVREALVPTLILQPLVENAIKHGVSEIEDGGRIELAARREGGVLHLSVRDNGPGMRGASGDGAFLFGIGLRNTKERLQSLYGDAHELALESDAAGVVARISLPFHTAADLYTTSV